MLLEAIFGAIAAIDSPKPGQPADVAVAKPAAPGAAAAVPVDTETDAVVDVVAEPGRPAAVPVAAVAVALTLAATRATGCGNQGPIFLATVPCTFNKRPTGNGGLRTATMRPRRSSNPYRPDFGAMLIRLGGTD